MVRKACVVRLLAIVPLLVGTLVLGNPSPAAAAYACTGYVSGQTIAQNLNVPAGTACELFETVVRGNVTVGAGASFVAFRSEIRGSLSGSGVDTVDVNIGTIRGIVRVTGAQFAQVRYVEIRGNVEITGVTERAQLLGSAVRGGASLNDNATLGVGANTIQGNLVCAGNGEVVSNGFSPSTVYGANTGQCAGF